MKALSYNIYLINGAPNQLERVNDIGAFFLLVAAIMMVTTTTTTTSLFCKRCGITEKGSAR